MKVIRVDARQVDMDLAEPYTIAYETVKSASNVFIEVRTDNTSGYGCSAPDLQVTGENAASVLEAIDQTVRPVLSGANPLRYGLLLEILKKELASRPAALAGVDMALYDLLGRSCGLPVWKLLGGYRERIMTSEQAFQLVRETGGCGLELLEQPTPRGEHRLLGHVTSRVPIPIMADESILSLSDAFRIAQGGRFEGRVPVPPPRCGSEMGAGGVRGTRDKAAPSHPRSTMKTT